MKYRSFLVIAFISVFMLNSLKAQQTPKGEVYDLNENFNWTSSSTFDIMGQLVSSNVSYFDDLGKVIQKQSTDIYTGKIWASQVFYDYQGRPALQTLSSPITSSDIGFPGLSTSFITLSTSDVESITDDNTNLPTVPTALNTLGWYYSNNNTSEPYQDITANPYSKTIYSTLNPGSVLKTVGGNKIDSEWKSGFSYTTPAPQEMYYVFGKDYFDGLIINGEEEVVFKVTKTVVIDVHGNETVIFTDTDGKTLAVARSGGTKKYEIVSLIGKQGFVDVHIPQGIDNSEIQFLGSGFTIYDLRTEQIVTQSAMEGGNLYRISLSEQPNPITYIDTNGYITTSSNPKGIRYPVNYYDYSLNYYDKAGRLIKSLQPIGFNDTCLNTIQNAVNHTQTLSSTYKYNTLGQLIETTSPDEGLAQFKYRQDGQIRFSQNDKQSNIMEYSYTNYDDLGRPIESGVAYKSPGRVIWDFTQFYQTDADNDIDADFKEQHYTIYDSNDNTGLHSALNVSGISTSNYPNQNFVSGNVVKTYTSNPSTSTTWYSYDIYGRVEWIVQDIPGLGIKTIDYEYDPVTSEVVKVDYQRYISNERFIHKYTYNVIGQLIQVETSTDDLVYTNQAKYEYYETGALKRTELADDLQGIDYVYNLAGQLKTINHPDLNSTSVPGNDIANGFNKDLFGMKIDYYNGDYLRDPQNIAGTDKGLNQFNGNIKAITWNTDANNDGLSQQNSYYYKYNKNNWLTDASYNLPLYNGYDNFTQTFAWKDFIEGNPSGGGSQSSLTLTNNTLTYYFNAGFVGSKILTGPIQQINSSVPDTNLGYLTVKTSSGTYYYDKFKVEIIDNWLYITASPPYDQFNYTSMVSNNNTAQVVSGDPVVDQSAEYNVYGITYDTNGNIKTLNRNREDGIINMDNFTYTYKANTNQLSHIDDTVVPSATSNDLDDQPTNNYTYNQIGQLIGNNAEGVTYSYNASGLVTEVKKNNQTLVKFEYDDKGKRVKKESYTSGTLAQTTHYVRDAAGSVMAIYTDGNQKELPIYGSSRLGVYFKDAATVYQLTDHLGNVRALVSKQDQQQPLTGFSDYYPFGMPMPNRNNQSAEGYRYSFQGQEKDPETGKEAFQLRLWDSRIGRWLTTDPAGQYNSPYLGMGNNPINGIDPDGALFGRIRSWLYAQFNGGYNYKNDHGDWIWSPGINKSTGNDIDGVNIGEITMRSFGTAGTGIGKWFTNRSSGSPGWGPNSYDVMGPERKRGKYGKTYESYDFNDFITPSNPNSILRKVTTFSRFLEGTQDGLEVIEHYNNIKTRIVEPMLAPNSKIIKENQMQVLYMIQSYYVNLDKKYYDSIIKYFPLNGTESGRKNSMDSLDEIYNQHKRTAKNYYK